MKIGVGLPFKNPTDSWPRIEQLIRSVEAGPYSSFAVLDRLVYDIFDPIPLLAAAAAITSRIRVMSAILVGPVRNAGILAKEAATVDAISGGRLTLGIAVGSRDDDAAVAPSGFHDRGKRFDVQLETMRQIWAGEQIEGAHGLVGPMPVQSGGPEMLIGGSADRAVDRVGRFGDGYIMGGRAMEAEWVKGIMARVQESWERHGRSGRPRYVATLPAALGPGSEQAVADAIADYYGGRPAAGAAREARPNPTSPQIIRDLIGMHEELGTDEIVFRPVLLDPDQIDRLTDVVS